MNEYSKKEVLKEVFESGYKLTVGQIPIVGGLLNTVMYEFSANLKQKRLNNFVLKLYDYFDSVSENDINVENIQTVDFHDTFESILIKISRTKSAGKIERYKQILLGQIKVNKDFDFIEPFIEITSKLPEKAFQLLNEYYLKDEVISSCNIKIKALENKVSEEEKLIGRDEKVGNPFGKSQTMFSEAKIESYRKEISEQYNIMNNVLKPESSDKLLVSDDIFDYLQNLLNTEFLIKRHDSNIPNLGMVHYYSISNFGKDYIEFIQLV
ncbi:MAG: hypothetical protein ACWA41_07935 [Putridiphycobacter sp.]